MTWPIKKLGEIAEVIMGQSPPSSSYNEQGNGLPFFQGKAEFGEIYPIPIKYCSSPSRIAEANDILISVRAPVGNINIAKEKSCVGRGLGALRAKKNILSQMFLFYFMKKNENNWSRLSTGSTFSAIKGSSLRNFEVLVPPLAIQKQIVDRMDKIAEAQKFNGELIQKTDELFQSFLYKELNPSGPSATKAMMDKKNREVIKLEEVLEYEQPTKYIVSSTDYKDKYLIPVLTAGKSFILGYTNENSGIFPKVKLPVIIFDDFTTASKFVDFPFKVKSSAMKILHVRKDKADINFLFYTIQTIKFSASQHKRYWISEYSKIEVPIPTLKIQKQIVAKLSAVQDYKKQLLAQKLKLKEFFDSVLNKSLKA